MGPEPTLLPAEPEIYQHLALGQEALDLVAKHPTSSLLWAILAEEAGMMAGLSIRTPMPGLATTGASIRCGATAGAEWGPSRGSTSPTAASCAPCTPWAGAASAIGEAEEPERIEKFLNDSDPTAKAAIGENLN